MKDRAAPDTAPTLFALLGTGDGPERVQLQRGEVLIEQGSPPDALYLVETGRFRVDRDGVELAEIGAGEALGEISFFTGLPRTARVTAARDSVVLKLSQADYEAATARDPAVARQVARDLALRLDATSARVRPEPRPPLARTVAVTGAGGMALPGGFLDGLAAALAAAGGADVQVVTRATAAAALGDGPLDPAAAVPWLHGLERAGGQVLLETAPEDRDWSELVLRQADQMLIVGRAGAVPALSETERFGFDVLAPEHRRLVLIHPERQDFVSGTGAWLDARPVFMHHHVAEGSTGDIARLARFLAGRALGFVASGGGAFGALHTGVFEALRQRGLAFDIFGGTSVGAAMCAAFAMGFTGDEIDARTAEIFVRNKALNRFTVPRYSVLDHTAFDGQLRHHYTDRLVEDLWLPFFAVTTDLSENRARTIRRGPLWQAVRASAAIPGALPPFYDAEGAMLVDGGTMDNLPVREMHALKQGPNVLVTFDREGRQLFDVRYDRLPGRGPLLRRLVLPFGKRPPRAPGIMSVVMRSLLARQAAEEPALGAEDWLIRAVPPKGAKFMDWTKHAQFYAAGQQTVAELLDAPMTGDDPRAAVMAMAG